MTLDDDDLPYGEDFHDPAQAAAWADAAARKRPWRAEIFDRFAAIVAAEARPGARVLELGSGPGFLAERVLDACPALARYTLLDFSEPMLALSRQRLARHVDRSAFVQADFKADAWPAEAGGPFDFVLSQQAVHELRHKRHAPQLYARVRTLLTPGGTLVVCDHSPEGAPTLRHRRLYMSLDEHRSVLQTARFTAVEVLWTAHAMAMLRAGRPSSGPAS